MFRQKAERLQSFAAIIYSANFELGTLAHLEAILLRPAFFQRHHEIGYQGHLFEFPFAVLAQVFVVVARRHQEGLTVIDGLRFEIGKAASAVAVQLDRVIVNELLDPGDARTILCSSARLLIKRAEKARDLALSVCLAEMREIEFAVRREQSRNLGELTFVDIFVVAIAQGADRFTIAQLLHGVFQFAHACFEIGCHGGSSDIYLGWSWICGLCSTTRASPTKAAKGQIRSR